VREEISVHVINEPDTDNAVIGVIYSIVEDTDSIILVLTAVILKNAPSIAAAPNSNELLVDVPTIVPEEEYIVYEAAFTLGIHDTTVPENENPVGGFAIAILTFNGFENESLYDATTV